jgi:DNA-binding CsgD family transcriptional regulator/PAS domain-containing protein
MTSDCFKLAGQTYECVEDPALWQDFLEGYAALVKAASAIMIAHDADTQGVKVLAVESLDLAYQRKHYKDYASRDVYIQRAREHGGPIGVVVPGHVMCPEQQLEGSEFYQDYLRPQNIYHSLGAVISTPQGWVNIGATRPRNDPRFGREEVAAAQALMPHLGRALSLSDKLQMAGQTLAATEVLYRVGLPVIMFDARATVMFVNAAAEEILQEQDGLEIRQGKLQAAKPTESAALRNLVDSAIAIAEGRPEIAGSTLQITRRSFRRSYIVSVYPLRRTLVAGREPRAVALLADPEAAAGPASLAPRLTALFGLSRAEARLADLIVRGRSLEEARDALHIGFETARTHLKRIMSKTGTRRQAELVRLLLNVATTTEFQLRPDLAKIRPPGHEH